MMWCHQRCLKILVFVLMLIVPNVHGVCQPPFENVSTDPLQERCVFVSNTTANRLTFPRARHACQTLNPNADLIKILSTDIALLTSHSAYNSTLTYYVGLTNAAIATSSENVLDCSAYNNLFQPLFSSDGCTATQCNCWALDAADGNLDPKSCLTEQQHYICGFPDPDDNVDVICPNGWVKIRDRCYRYYTGVTNVTTFQQAQDVCYAAQCGSLARLNFYDCNYAAILGGRPNTSISYLVGLMGTNGSEEWRDGSMPDTNLIFATGTMGDCFVLDNDNTSSGALSRVECNDTSATQNFICERESLIPTTPGMQTTDGGGTTAGLASTGGPASTDSPLDATTSDDLATTGRGDVTTVIGDVTTGRGDVTTVIGDVTTGRGDVTTGSAEPSTARIESTTSIVVTADSVMGFGLDDPCIPNPCDNTGTGLITCVTNSANIAECVCSAGFELNGEFGPCVDINECDRNLHNCDVATEECVNNDGSFACNQRTTGDQGVNECANPNDNTCDLSTTYCQNANDGYTCECLGARERVDGNSCTDQCAAAVDPCDEDTTVCVALSDGLASCQCRVGYQPISGNPNVCQPNSGLSARMSVRMISISGRNLEYTPPLANRTSSEFRETESQICDAIETKLEHPLNCNAGGFDQGSIIAYLVVSIPSPSRILRYEEIKSALINGPINENGYITLYTSDGTDIVIDTNRLDVDDLANYVCRSDTCQNGGSCTFDERFIQTNCQCADGFQGTRCEARMVSAADGNNTGLLIGLSLLAVGLLIVFTCCFCCVCAMSRRKLQSQNKRVFRYQPPVTGPPSQSSRHYGIQRIFHEISTDSDRQSERPFNFPAIIRNRAVAHSIENDNYAYELEEFDAESFIDDERMRHYKNFFSNSNHLNSRMSARGDGASTVASTTMLSPSSHMDDEESHSHDFYRPYTVDGTENI